MTHRKRITNDAIIDLVRQRHGDDGWCGNDILSAYCDLRTLAHGSDSWMRFGAMVRGASLLNGLRADRLEEIEHILLFGYGRDEEPSSNAG